MTDLLLFHLYINKFKCPTIGFTCKQRQLYSNNRGVPFLCQTAFSLPIETWVIYHNWFLDLPNIEADLHAFFLILIYLLKTETLFIRYLAHLFQGYGFHKYQLHESMINDIIKEEMSMSHVKDVNSLLLFHYSVISTFCH